MRKKDYIIDDKKKRNGKLLLQRKLIQQKKHFNRYEEFLILVNKKSIIHGFAPLNLRVQISVNIGCNANCIMCDKRYDPKISFSYDSVLKLIAYLDGETVNDIIILGGEPLLDKAGLLKVIKTGKEKDIIVSFVTNGWFLTEKYIDELVDNGVHRITISVDGLGAHHDRIRGISGLFNKICKIIKYIKKRYPSFILIISSMLMKETIDHASELISWACGMGVHTLSFCRMENYNRNYNKLHITDRDYQDFFDKFFRKIQDMNIDVKQRYCDMRKNTSKCDYLFHRLNMNDQGKIIPCQDDGNAFYLDRPIKELYQDPDFRDFILSKVNTCGGYK